MRTFSCCVGAFLLVSAIGCTTRSDPGGGGDRANKFNLSGPKTSTSIKQGETQTVTIKVERGKEFKQAVALKAEPPTGVDAELGSASHKASDKEEISLKLTANDKATVGEHTVRLIGTPESGTATTLDIKVKVLDRADVSTDTVKLSLSGPLLSTTIKQGETQTIPLTLKQSGGKYAGNVKLGVDGPPKGITTEFTKDTIKGSDSGDIGLKVTVDKTAALGDHTLRVTGAPDTGTVNAADVKLKVVAP